MKEISNIDKEIINNWFEASQRYMESEDLLLDILSMPFYKRIFCGKLITKYFERVLNKTQKQN